MKKDNYESELPEGYELKLHIDAKNKKTTVIYKILSLVPIIITAAISMLLIYFVCGWDTKTDGVFYPYGILICLGILILYVILHELVHGITYKILTGGKLTFGLKWNVAFCGVPDIYVYRKAAKIAVLMPFLVFNVIFVGLTVGMYFVNSAMFFISSLILGIHIGGCAGDLHVTYMFDHKFKDEKTLMRDTGPEQFFYVYTGKVNTDIV